MTGAPWPVDAQKARMFGAGGPLPFRQDADGLHVQMPEARPCEYAYTLKMTLSETRG